MKRMMALLMAISCLLFLAAYEKDHPDTTKEAGTTPSQFTDPNETEPAAPVTESTPQPACPRPIEMVGTWKRIRTEVQGDINSGGDCTIIIEGTGEDSLTISFTDNNLPDFNFSTKALTVVAEEMYTSCGNNQWLADIDHVGLFGTTYRITLLVDGILLLQNNFYFDGTPMVSYEFFVREA